MGSFESWVPFRRPSFRVQVNAEFSGINCEQWDLPRGTNHIEAVAIRYVAALSDMPTLWHHTIAEQFEAERYEDTGAYRAFIGADECRRGVELEGYGARFSFVFREMFIVFTSSAPCSPKSCFTAGFVAESRDPCIVVNVASSMVVTSGLLAVKSKAGPRSQFDVREE
ncbi:hypothetical protein D9619_000172 [Psilocybe cf. subviscida]|uniref:Uncharacterized protein n=1 Tax=Psilocybe cf. subviscida TaxID=2480587 RepID=A0A8H5F3V6_9AGAR|nr:hypothetical protein D9619_000172 [Psilocybe cf. subviscida]